MHFSVLFMTSDIVASVTFGVIADIICGLDIFTFLTGVDAESDIGGKNQVELRIITWLFPLLRFLFFSGQPAVHFNFHVKVGTSCTLTGWHWLIIISPNTTSFFETLQECFLFLKFTSLHWHFLDKTLECLWFVSSATFIQTNYRISSEYWVQRVPWLLFLSFTPFFTCSPDSLQRVFVLLACSLND